MKALADGCATIGHRLDKHLRHVIGVDMMDSFQTKVR